MAVTACGDSAVCAFKLDVRDLTKPIPVPKTAVLGNIGTNGQVKFTARQLNQSSSDNCTAAPKLCFSFSQNLADSLRTFGCWQLGQHTVNLFVFDEAGNRASAPLTLTVLDGMGRCQMTDFQGIVQTEEGLPVGQVQVELKTPNVLEQATTGADGRFDFPQISGDAPCSLTPTRGDNPLNGINALDLKLLYRHILGLEEITSPYKLIAADVNRNGRVTLADMLELRSLLLGETTEFANNTSWRFVDAAFKFNPFADPLGQTFPEKISLQKLPAGNADVAFVGIKIGDLNGDASPAFAATDERTEKPEPISLILENQAFRRGDVVPFAIYGPPRHADLAAFQFTLDFDMNTISSPVAQVGPTSGTGFEQVGLAHSDAGSFTLAWAADATQNPAPPLIMYGTFTARADGQLSDALHLTSRFTPARAFDKQGNMFELKADFIQPHEGKTTSTATNPSLQLFANAPNPFTEMTLLRFRLPGADDVSLRIFDQTGRTVLEKAGNFSSGDNYFLVDRSEIGESGVYVFEMRSSFGTATRRFIML